MATLTYQRTPTFPPPFDPADPDPLVICGAGWCRTRVPRSEVTDGLCPMCDRWRTIMRLHVEQKR